MFKKVYFDILSHTNKYTYVHIYIYIYIYRERERAREKAHARTREREREREKGRERSFKQLFESACTPTDRQIFIDVWMCEKDDGKGMGLSSCWWQEKGSQKINYQIIQSGFRHKSLRWKSAFVWKRFGGRTSYKSAWSHTGRWNSVGSDLLHFFFSFSLWIFSYKMLSNKN